MPWPIHPVIVTCTLLLLPASTLTTAAEVIDVRELGRPDATGRAMPGFYVVKPDGESAAVDPVEAGLATTSSADFSAPPPPEPPPPATTETAPSKSREASNERDGPRRVLVRIKRKQPERSLSRQFQCERHGFYYTNDGRCILPAWGRVGVMPHLLPSPGAAVPMH